MTLKATGGQEHSQVTWPFLPSISLCCTESKGQHLRLTWPTAECIFCKMAASSPQLNIPIRNKRVFKRMCFRPVLKAMMSMLHPGMLCTAGLGRIGAVSFQERKGIRIPIN